MLELPETGKTIIAVDEAGRGCLAFEVCAAAVVLPNSLPNDDDARRMIDMIKDSKKLSFKKRTLLADFIKRYAIAYGIGISSPDEIDRVNILQATFNAMHRAIDQVFQKLEAQGYTPDSILVDGDKFKPYMPLNGTEWLHHSCVPGGDNIHMNIAAASILAKTHRDSLVDSYVEQHPDFIEKYGFDKNKAYGTVKHMEGLAKYGTTSFHRKSFAPVRKYL